MIRLYELTKLLPQLSYETVKGSNGRVGVIGGSFQYTGAPYYAAMAAVKMGADIAHIFCSKQAAIPIKSYSPQLIVHPLFNYDSETVDKLTESQIQQMTSKWIQYIKGKFERIQSWVIGPGLGRSKCLSLFFQNFIKQLPKESNLVIDADGLYFLCKFPQLLKKIAQLNCILTPNRGQFKHINKLLQIDEKLLQIDEFRIQQIEKQNKKKQEQEFQNKITNQNIVAYRLKIDKDLPAIVILKGYHDIILNKNNEMIVIIAKGSKKRCGGIGDVLSGCVASSIVWSYQKGSFLACYVTKQAARKAFQKHGRALTGLGVLQQLSEIVKSFQ